MEAIMKIKSLKEFIATTKETNPKLAAEGAYALAVILRRKANEAGKECLELLGKTKQETLEDCAPTLVTVAGVPIPDIFHADVVKKNLAGLDI
jgi:hypothetical protein